jgi:hypothetical protein
MSTIQTNAIVDAAGGNTASVNGVTPNTHSVRGRNLIINGDMRVAQRGTSFTSSGSGLFTLDRWVSGVHTGTGDGDMTQETDAPTAVQSGTNFTHSLKFQVTTANTSIQATDRKYHVYRIEGQDLAPAGFGQAGTRYMTLSFWHKHTKTGIHSLAINNAARNRSYPMEYTQTTTNTWEKAELTFPVDTTGTWLGGNGIGMWIFFGAAFGSNYAATVNQWGAGQKYGTANQVNNYDSTSNSMQFTGVQLELGSVATEFDHRSYAEELVLCQRYYERIEAGASSSYIGWSAGTIYGSGTYLGHFTASVPMRVTPTFSTNAYSNASRMSVVSGNNTYEVTSIVVTGINQRLRINAAGSLSSIIGQGAYIQVQNGYHVAFDAEY